LILIFCIFPASQYVSPFHYVLLFFFFFVSWFFFLDFVDHWILETQTSMSPKNMTRNYSYQPFPTPAYTKDVFASSISGVIGLFYTIIYIWPVTRLVKGIVEEKQLRIKEGMLQMGLPSSALFCSWLGTYALMFFITSIGITLVTAGSVYENSNKVYIFLYFFFFAMSTFTFCWFLSVFFSRAQVATTVAALLFLGLYFTSC
jgi:ABC-type multidrug transport system fused ATPase/permease subunit